VRVLVTGGSGFLGGCTIPELCRRGHTVVALARSARAADRISALGAEPVTGDIDNAASLEAAFLDAKADALVNLASLGFGHAQPIVAATEQAGLVRAVFVSTTAIFTGLNAPSKAVRVSAEQIIRGSALDWTIVRPTMIYGGPGDRNLSRLLALLRRMPVVPLPGGGTRMQQPVHVADLASAIATVIERPAAIGQAYEVAGPAPVTFADLIRQAGVAVGRKPVLIPVPLAPAVGMARLYERLAEHPRIKAEQLERLAEDKAFDITAARRDLDFQPRTLAEGLREEAAMLR